MAGRWLSSMRAFTGRHGDGAFRMGVGTALPMVFAVLLAAAVRFTFVLGSDFPLNDGGLFAAMIGDLQSNGYRIPQASSYNGIEMPFAYPPFTFYLVAAIEDLLHIDVVTQLRVLPTVASLLALPAFWLIARNTLKSGAEITLAVVAFALVPRAFDWEIVGGGLTRSFGFSFALFAIHQSFRLSHGGAGAGWALGGFWGATALSHPEMALFAAISHGTIVLSHANRRSLLEPSSLAAALAVVIGSAWWLPVVWMHGVGPLLSAGRATPVPLVGVLRVIVDPQILNEPLFPLQLALALAGAAWCVGARQPLLPVWVLALLALDPRKAPTAITVPVALLVAIAVSRVFLPVLAMDSDRRSGRIVKRSLGYVLVLLWTVSAIASPAAERSPMVVLAPQARDALAQLDREVPPSAAFLVISGYEWARDPLSEWFPVLASRQSLATPQGYEWLGSGRFAEQVELHASLQDCGSTSLHCAEELAVRARWNYSHVAVATGRTFTLAPGEDGACCAAILNDLAADTRYRRVLDGPGLIVFEREMRDTPPVN